MVSLFNNPATAVSTMPLPSPRRSTLEVCCRKSAPVVDHDDVNRRASWPGWIDCVASSKKFAFRASFCEGVPYLSLSRSPGKKKVSADNTRDKDWSALGLRRPSRNASSVAQSKFIIDSLPKGMRSRVSSGVSVTAGSAGSTVYPHV